MNLVFPQHQIFRDIREAVHASDFDCRDKLIEGLEPDYKSKMTESFRRGYMCVKWAIAKVRDPGRILEIGVGSGISALAFLTACPNAHYLGIDNGQMEKGRGVGSLVARARELLTPFPDASVIWDDSQKLAQLYGGPYDPIHVDGDHRRHAACHDVSIAWYALSPSGILVVDDSRDSSVAAGVFDAIQTIAPGSIDWAYLEDSWAGNIIIRREKTRP